MRTTACIMLLLPLLLQGCGRKGPLILSPAPTVIPHSAPAASTPEKPETKKEP